MDFIKIYRETFGGYVSKDSEGLTKCEIDSDDPDDCGSIYDDDEDIFCNSFVDYETDDPNLEEPVENPKPEYKTEAPKPAGKSPEQIWAERLLEGDTGREDVLGNRKK